jgi:hypothetical protein
MASVAPVSITEGRPHFGETGSYSLTAYISSAGNLRTCGGLEDTIVGHERHQRVDIVAIPGIGEGSQHLDSDLLNHIWHD